MNECTWTYDQDDEGAFWETACGEGFCFAESGPEENGFRFCCYCGGELKPIRISAAKENRDET